MNQILTMPIFLPEQMACLLRNDSMDDIECPVCNKECLLAFQGMIRWFASMIIIMIKHLCFHATCQTNAMQSWIMGYFDNWICC